MFSTSALLLALAAASFCAAQEYDFGAEIKRQCLVPDPVGLLDCVENKVTLPYLTSWVDCTNSLGQNVKTSADIINYRCKSVWEGKAVIPEVFYIKDCVIEKTGLPAKNVSAEVLGAYKECENNPQPQIRQAPLSGVKTAPIQQQQIDTSGRQMTMQPPQPIVQTQITPQQPYSQQFFAIYPPTPIQQQPQQAPFTQQQQAPSPQQQQAPFIQQQAPFTQQQAPFTQQQAPFTQQQQAPFIQQQAPFIQQQQQAPFTQQQQQAPFIQQQAPFTQQQQVPYVQPQPLFATIPESILLAPIKLGPRPTPRTNQQQQVPRPVSPQQVQTAQPQQYQYQVQVQHPVQQSIKI